MKFGKALADQLPHGDAWRPHALAYKQLKRLLKRCVGISRHQKLHAATFARCHALIDRRQRTDAALQTSSVETAFFAALRDELRKVNRFFLSEQHLSGKRVRLLEGDVRTALANGQVQRDSAAWLERCAAEYSQLHALEQFCVMNFCAVIKILKKHDKWTAYDTRSRFERAVLVKQPFATYLPLLEMLRRVEALAVSISMVALTAGSSPSQPAAPARVPGHQPPQQEFKLPPLRIAIGWEDEEGAHTDSEDLSPRDELPGSQETREGRRRASSISEPRMPRQRRRFD